jgi:hypothetical protein
LNIESLNENRRWFRRSMRDGHPSYRAVPEDRRIVLPEDLLAASDIGLLFVDNSLLVQGYSTTILPFVSTEHCAVGRSAFHLSRDLGGTEFVNGIRRVLARQVSEDRTLQSRGGALLIRMSPAVMRVGPGVLVTVANVSAVTRNYDVVRRVLDSLPANIAFLDRLGNIRLTNGAWDRFGAENGRELGASLVGANYLDACAGSIGDVALNGIRSVLDERHRTSTWNIRANQPPNFAGSSCGAAAPAMAMSSFLTSTSPRSRAWRWARPFEAAVRCTSIVIRPRC